MTAPHPEDPWGDVTAVILAGGLGTRLQPVVGDRPKGLAAVAGRPFLAHLMDQLCSQGIRRVVVSTGHGAGQIREALGGAFGGMSVGYSHETQPLGRGGALQLAALGIASPTLLVLNGDSFCRADLTAFLQDFRRHDRKPALLLVRMPDVSRYGRVECDAAGAIRRFEEKAAASGAGWINAGVYLVDRALAAGIPAGRAVSLEREVFPTWIASGLRGYPCDAAFLDIGTPESYARAADFFAPAGDVERAHADH
jgi:NDP-sugar pyrophosphorylase family protein